MRRYIQNLKKKQIFWNLRNTFETWEEYILKFKPNAFERKKKHFEILDYYIWNLRKKHFEIKTNIFKHWKNTFWHLRNTFQIWEESILKFKPNAF